MCEQVVVCDETGTSGLREVLLRMYQVTVTLDDDSIDGLTCRVVLPNDIEVDGQWFWTEYLDRLLEDTQSASEDEYWDFCELWQLFDFHGVEPGLDRRRDRNVTFKSLRRLEAFTSDPKILLESLAADAPDDENRSQGDEDLLANAIYETLNLYLPMSEDSYGDFRAMLLDELLEVDCELHRIADQAIKEIRQENPGLDEDSLRDKRLDGILAAKRLIIREAIRLESERSNYFEKAVEHGRLLLNQVADHLAEQGLPVALDDDLENPRQIALISECFDIETANCIFDEFISAFRALRRSSEQRNTKHASSWSATDQNHYELIEEAKRNHDAIWKWEVLLWAVQNLTNRNECLRLFQREAENAWVQSMGRALRRVYRVIRGSLTRYERRAFVLFYLPSLRLSGRIAAFDPVVGSFLWGTDEETQSLILLVMVFGVKSHNGEDIAAELHRRWQNYLQLYPAWHEVIRSEERERKKSIRRKFVSLNDSVPGNPDAELLAGLPAREERSEALWEFTDHEGTSIKDLTERFCTKKQADYIAARFEEGLTESEIARKYRVSQQSVNKTIQKALQKMRSSLVRLDPEAA